MKLLIVYASAGFGHRKAAEAVYESLDESLKKESCLVDILDFTPRLFKIAYTKGYTFLIRYLPWTWAFFYWLSDLKCLFLLFKLLRRISNYGNTFLFSGFVKRNKPRVILSTHFMPGEVLANLKKRKEIDSFLISILTDYVVHSFWVEDAIDSFIVGHACVKEALIKKGISEAKILDLGIPVGKGFLNLRNARGGLKSEDTSGRDFKVLLVTGSLGLNILGKIAKQLERQMQVIVICGANRRLLQELESLNSKNISAFGLVDNMYAFMDSCDIIITKAGGLTIAESLLAVTPMCFIANIGGQEAGNIKVLTSLGCAIYERNLNKLAEKALELKAAPHRLAIIRENINRVSRPEANSQILSIIRSHVS